MRTKGVVETVRSREINTKNGAALVYSFKADGQWYGAGFNKPNINDGDRISFTIENNGNYKNAKDIELEAANTGGQATAGPTAATALTAPNDREKSIHYQSSRKDAIAVVELLLAQSAVPIKSTKPEERMLVIMALIDDTTEKFYHRIHTFVSELNEGVPF